MDCYVFQKLLLIIKDIIISEKAYLFELNYIFAQIGIDTFEELDYAKFIYK
jgi:hypothetical protein